MVANELLRAAVRDRERANKALMEHMRGLKQARRELVQAQKRLDDIVQDLASGQGNLFDGQFPLGDHSTTSDAGGEPATAADASGEPRCVQEPATAGRQSAAADAPAGEEDPCFAQQMAEAKSAEEGRKIIHQHKLALNAFEVGHNLPRNIHPTECQWVGFSVITESQWKKILKSARKHVPLEIVNRYQALIQDGLNMRPHWEKLLHSEQEKWQPHPLLAFATSIGNTRYENAYAEAVAEYLLAPSDGSDPDNRDWPTITLSTRADLREHVTQKARELRVESCQDVYGEAEEPQIHPEDNGSEESPDVQTPKGYPDITLAQVLQDANASFHGQSALHEAGITTVYQFMDLVESFGDLKHFIPHTICRQLSIKIGSGFGEKIVAKFLDAVARHILANDDAAPAYLKEWISPADCAAGEPHHDEPVQRTFHGQTYWYNTPAHGEREIGVTQGIGSLNPHYIVAYRKDNGAKKRVNTNHLPECADPSELQAKLDSWAAKHKFFKVAESTPESSVANS